MKVCFKFETGIYPYWNLPLFIINNVINYHSFISGNKSKKSLPTTNNADTYGHK